MVPIRVLLTGAAGKMGQELVRTIAKEKDILLVATCDLQEEGRDVGEVAGIGKQGVKIQKDVRAAIETQSPQVICDFTQADALRKNLPLYLTGNASLVIGTTGLSQTEINNLQNECRKKKVGCLLAPNFALGAVLMMHFSQIAARFMDGVEIIEFHHPQKKDAPSGTAIKTAEGINKDEIQKEAGREVLTGARGAQLGSVHIHSVRLPGYVAHQEVIFGGQGQTLTIRHDSIDRSSFMPGIITAIRKMANDRNFYYGLESILDL
ncbi:MAG: 4-hydroxy-tetrahydrodipicolinate reductase [Candidatus Atribacteria bacterium]|nr:4-hydroxy-tetrahydrodipicolinate reductase [Candidatus Atribacteria bacterium]